MGCDIDLMWSYWTLAIRGVIFIIIDFNMAFLGSGNENKAKLIRLDPKLISLGTSCGAIAEIALASLYFTSCEIKIITSPEIFVKTLVSLMLLS
jgi:hypothetical protein